MFVWQKNEINSIVFVMVDANGDEVTGLGGTFTLELCQPGGSFASSTGTKTEIGSGWYRYAATSAEAATSGTVGIKVTAAGCVQQNLIATVSGDIGSSTYTDTITDDDGDPLEDVQVEVYSDSDYTTLVAVEDTDVNGVFTFSLNPGTYYVRCIKSGYTFTDFSKVVT